MKKFYTLLTVIALLPAILHAQLNGSYIISGKVVSDQGQPVQGANVILKGTKRGTITDSLGNFSLTSNQKFPIRIIFNSIGFAPYEIEVKNPDDKVAVQLATQTYMANEVIVTASRQQEKLLTSPVTVEKLDIKALKETPAPSFYDALANVKGVQMTTASLTFKVPNTRGFNMPNNFRFMQLVDGVDVQAATLGVPLGNAIGPTELDIQSVEITPGASSALYGMNAINGMSQLITKNPFTTEGLSLYQKTGVNHVNDNEKNASLLSETAIRYAKAFNNKFAFKINASYFVGSDWVADSKVDFNPQPIANPLFPQLSGAHNPAYDGTNSYGNESNISVTDKDGQVFNVRRTGYAEKDMTNYDARNIKFDAGLYYKIRPNLQISYTYRYGSMDGIFMRGNRIRLQGANVQNHKIEITHSDFTIRGYVSLENSGHDSYALKPLADNLESSFKTNKQWAKDYTTGLNSALTSGDDLATAHQAARAFADQGRFLPGTQAFDQQVAKLKNINNWDSGAAMWTSSRFYQLEGTWNLNKYIHWINVLVGADYRLYDLIPDGNNFVDFSKPIDKRNTPGGNNIYYSKVGGFVQGTKWILNRTLKLTGSLRFDKNSEYTAKLNPRIAAVYSLNKIHNFRFSWQNGFRFPSLFEAYSFVNNGGVRRVGGLPIVEEGLNYYTNSVLTNSVTAYNTAVNTAKTQGASQTDAELASAHLLKVANPQPLKPEQISSFELGYTASLLDNKLFVDVEGYFNIYKYFIGQLEVSVPNNGSVSNLNDTAVLHSLTSNYSKYRVQVNSQSNVKNYGFAGGVTYNFYKTYSLSANANYNKLAQTNTSDPLIPGFNTPNWATNVSFGNRAITKNFGFNIVWHWQNSFYWQNLFGNGTVDAYSTIDAQITYHVPEWKSSFKFGGADILNHKYSQYIGGPTISALYYVTWTIDDLFAKK
jgi:outer membrane receptor protein involved in Fe transport